MGRDDITNLLARRPGLIRTAVSTTCVVGLPATETRRSPSDRTARTGVLGLAARHDAITRSGAGGLTNDALGMKPFPAHRDERWTGKEQPACADRLGEADYAGGWANWITPIWLPSVSNAWMNVPTPGISCLSIVIVPPAALIAAIDSSIEVTAMVLTV
jgi:hypothetical protein